MDEKKTVPKTLRGLNDTLNRVDFETFCAGFSWYKEAHAFALELSSLSGFRVEIVCGVIAVLSPACSWENNKKDAACMLLARNPRSVVVKSYGTNRIKALNIIENGDLSEVRGKKVLSFYHNILEPDCPERVTIDRHALRALLGKPDSSAYSLPSITSLKRYTQAQDLYKRLANKLGILPNQAQAILWKLIVNERQRL